ncbi:hypothetical protein [Nocardia suismassiliense]|uniref:hypothetical protein n=1 Tax=Nocardia suismassiliense TaxID=2077092 RepID=UPI000D1EC92B|nr:hypothetical protein [Nocardia suismassiliense]
MSDDWFDESPDPTYAPTPSLSVVSRHEQDDQDWFDTSPEPATPAPEASKPPVARLRRRPRRRPPLPVVIIGALTATGTIVVCAAMLMRPASPAPPNLADPTTTAATSSAVKPWCTEIGAGQPVSMTATEPGLAAIAAFEKAYYLDRDAVTARLHVAADARVGSVDQLKAGIDTVPAGTTHCVLATPVQPGMWSVELYTRRPDGTLEHFPQTITTIAAATAPKGALITAILPRGDN